MYPAMSQTDNLKCPSCGQVYSVRDLRGNMLPRILKCGHTCCEACIRSRASQNLVCTCPVCEDEQKFTSMGTIQSLLLDSYTLGVGAASLRQHHLSARGPDLDPFFVAMRPTARSKEVASKGPVVLCDECGRRPASCGCDTCPSNFCKPCFNEIHGSAKTMRKHKPKALRPVSVAAEMAAVCDAHKRVREFFCVTDNMLICPLCLVSGDQHKDHNVVPMAEQDAKALPELKSALDEAQKSYQGLKQTFEKLDGISKACENHVKSQMDAVHAHFQHLHCLLQLRMHRLLADIKKVGYEHVQGVQEQLRTVESKIEEFKGIRKDASAAIASSNPEHTAFLLEQMKSFADMPCFITSDIESCKPGIEVQYEPSLSEALKSYGKLRFTLPDKLSLLPVKDLPEGYLEEEPDNTDSDSVCSVEASVAVSSVASDESSVAEQYDSKRVTVSHIRDLSYFFVQPTCLDAKLRKMQSEIRDYCRMPDTRPLHEDEIVPGDLYLAQFKQDRIWYRCRAVRTVPADVIVVDGPTFRQSHINVEVFYIDYGNSEVVPLQRMRRMSPRFDKLCPVAIKCSLYNVVPLGNSPLWRRESNAVFGKLTEDKKLILKEVRRLPDTLVVDLLDDSEDGCGEVRTSLSDAMVFLGMASYHMPPLNAPVAETTGAVRRRYYPPVELLAGQVTSVLISSIYNPHNMFVQQLGSHEQSLQELLRELQAHCRREGNELDLVFVPREGMPCLTQFPSDKMWYRAKIVGLPSESRVQVVYVDYGNEETVPARSLRRIPERFMHLPVQAVPVRLADVAPNSDGAWSSMAKERLVKVTSTRRLIMKVHGSSGEGQHTKVTLYIPGKSEMDVCVNALLVKEGLAKSTGPLSLMENVPSLKAQLPPHQKTSLVAAVEETIMINKLQKRLAATMKSRPPLLSNPPEPSSVSTVLTALDTPLTQPVQAPPTEPDRPKENYVPVQVTHVESPVKFYVRMLDERKSLEKLHSRLQSAWDMVSGAGDGQVAWVDGQWCAAKHGRQWVRGRVVSLGEGVATVRLVDSGKQVDVPTGDLAPLPLELTLAPPFAQPCHLADMIPAGGSERWCKTAEECFAEFLSTKNRVFVVHMGEAADGSLPVDVMVEEIIEPGALEPRRKEYRSARTKLRDMGFGFVVKRSGKEAGLPSKSGVPESKPSNSGRGTPSLPDTKPAVPESTPNEKMSEPDEESRVNLQETALGGSSTDQEEKYDDAKPKGPSNSPPEGMQAKDSKAGRPESAEAAQPESAEAARPESAEAVQPEGAKAVQPEGAKAVQLEAAEAVQPQDAGAVQLEDKVAVQPQGAEAVQPEGKVAEQPKGAGAVKLEVVKTMPQKGTKGVQLKDAVALQPGGAEAVHGDGAEPVQLEDVKTVPQEGTKGVQSKDAAAVQPGGAEPVQLEDGKTVPQEGIKGQKGLQPKDAAAVQPGGAEAVHGDGAEPVQPKGAKIRVAGNAVTEDGGTKETARKMHSPDSKSSAGEGDKNEVVFQDNQELFKWKPRAFPKEKQMLVMPSHIDEDAIIYSQVLGKDIELYKVVKETLFEAYDKRPKPVHRTLQIGQACIARYSADLKFYRAVILNVGEKGVEVRFVDYGTTEYADPDNIYTDLMFEDLPILCIEAELYGLRPFSSTGSWPLKTLDGLHYMLVEKSCSLVVKEAPTDTTRAQVYLFLPDGVSVHEVLLETGLAYRLENAPPVQQENKEEEEAEKEEVIPCNYEVLPLPKSGVFPVLVTNLETANAAFIQRCKFSHPSNEEEEAVNRRLDEFFSMTEELQKVAEDCPPLPDAALGTPCIGKYSYDKLWYRGLIIDAPKNKKKVTVYYVDYGNNENLSKSSLRVLPEKFRAIPMQAHKCYFHGVEVKEDPEKATTRLSEILFEKDNTDYLAKIKKNDTEPVEIDLMNTSLDLVYEPLVEEGFISIERGRLTP